MKFRFNSIMLLNQQSDNAGFVSPDCLFCIMTIAGARVRLAPSLVPFDTNPTVGDAKQAFRISSGPPLLKSRFRTMIHIDVSLGRVLGKEAG
jgi:hypothetical protein